MVIKNDAGIDAAINAAMEPLAAAISSFVFYSVEITGTQIPLIVVWLIAAAAFFTFYFGFKGLSLDHISINYFFT